MCSRDPAIQEKQLKVSKMRRNSSDRSRAWLYRFDP